ncbi:MAG: leucine-rich repeat protein, partial [Muribaculaceae bacterium]|nr:leucine-rich repeat protein [Muribaculaceae bacterium]
TLKTVKIGDKATVIPPYLLCGRGIQSINLPNSFHEIGHSAFYNSNLRSVILPPSIIAVQSGAFKSCYNISKVAYPEDFPNPFPYGRAIAYPRDCFIDDSGVIYDAQKTTLYFAPIEIEGAYQTLPSTTSIVESAFYNCDKLNEITITDDIAEIGSGAFSGCENLIKLSYLAINCKNASNYNMFPNSIESLIVGDKVTSIPDYFLNWINSNTTPSSSLVLKELSLPASLTSIGVAAFCGLEVVTLITIPEGVKSIGDWAFSYCTKLDTLSLPQSLSSIGNFTFAFSNPSVVTSLSAEPPACGNNAFYSPKGTLYVPAESIDDYANAPVWQSFSSIKSIPVLVSSVEVTPETLSGAVGQTAQLTASVTPADASNPALMWISADPEVASVDQNGLVTFISGGATTITVSSTDGSDVSVIIPVTVNDPSGVDDVNLGNTVKIDVFTLDGVSILHNASTSHLSKLAKGIYILKSDDTVQKIIIK